MTQRGYMTKEIDKYSIDNTDYTVGQDNVQKWGVDVHNPVFGISAGLIAAFLLLTVLVDAHQAKIGLDTVKQGIIASFDWLLSGRVTYSYYFASYWSFHRLAKFG